MHFFFRSARSNIDAHPSFRFSRSFLSQALKEELARIGLIVEVEFPPKTLLSRCAHLFFLVLCCASSKNDFALLV